MTVVFRVDASRWIGSGHVMRCLVLAEILSERGWNVQFACIPQEGDLITLIEQKGYAVIRLCPPLVSQPPRFDGDYESWLHRSEHEDAIDFIEKVTPQTWVVVDHYSLGHQWERAVCEGINCQLLVIDDLNRQHESDVILDQNLWPDMGSRYIACQSKKLLGPKYALLRPRFRELKYSPPQKRNQVIAFFGGADLTQECQKLQDAAMRISSLPFQLKIVTGRQNKGYEALLKIEKPEWIEVVQYLDDFELELAKSKYAIGASGVSNWERFCLDIPSTIVSVADNQRTLSQYLYQQGFVSYLGSGEHTTPETYINELMRIKENWQTIAQCNHVEVDGEGAQRVVNVMESFR
ncbi:UDP-2,4-diacetamido-2,4,6-trideoxy-beta-L-altropyranose hydrolase [Vibrio vulnificus]|nr:UDP-2,4-diacetamido-2,4,6-trideoxy-beta-L-altropyranose hydrolase [Vibrio vulnificus]MCG6285685.1 UDP-2,4-diacetamido-2,4,6-trideoxy-beta-L-altropyranose hydrolase [Vibrio vulnificus]HAS6271565.1 UDP-2,4-diacetamido-2,4,6-trideoxy-beta-L-altropyranose hydrolase [Vibrio vulnificus]HDY7428107.1 UDP-2,4-diacetamido-2,4,6-trideoxy-beta-L-altropyranose hydrolase [Vibrio vulnificus]